MKHKNLKYYKVSFLFISLLLLQQILFSQEIHSPHINYTSEDGLPSDQVYQCMQDREGYMWFVTDNGVSKFDGYTFKNYGTKDGLTQPVIFNIQEDKYGRILMSGLNKEFFVLDKKTDRIKKIESVTNTFKSNRHFKLEFYFDNITEKLIVKEYINENIYIFNKYFELEKEYKSSIPSIYYNDNFVTIFGPGIELNCLQEINIIDRDFKVEGKVYIQSANEFYYNYNKTDSLIVISTFKKNIVIDKNLNVDYFSKYEFNNLTKHKEYFFGLSNSRGLAMSKSFKLLANNDYKILIPNIEVTNILKDKHDNIWCTTLNNGILLLKSNHHIHFNVNTNEKFKNILLTQTNKAFLISTSEKVFETDFNTIDLLHSDGKYSDIIKSKKDYFFFKNELLYKKEGPALTQITFKNLDSGTAIKSIVFDPTNDNIIYAISSWRIFKFNLKNKLVEWLYDFQRNQDLLFTSDRKLIIATTKGVGEMKDNRFEIYPTLGSFANQRIDFLEELSNGNIIFASKTKGLFVKEKSAYFSITRYNSNLPSEINCIKIDKYDNIWIGSNDGLFKIKYKGLGIMMVERTTEFQGLPSNIVSDIEYDSIENKIYAVTPEGIFIYDCNIESHEATKNLPTTISGMTINNHPSIFYEGRKFNSDSNNLSFTLLSKQYKMNGKIPYQFKLNDGVWEDLGTNRVINLLALKPGKYTLYYRAKNEYGTWNAPNKSSFEILQPWYQTTLFYFISFGFMATSFYLYYRRRVRLIKKDNALREEISNLERVALQTQMNPHFVFNSLNSIQNYILNNDKIEASEYLSKFAALVRTNLYYSNKNKISLNDEIKMLNNYLELEKMRFKNKFQYTINFKNELINPIKDIFIAPMLIQPIIENSIKHGISESKNFGSIIVEFEEKDDFLIVTVEDDGPGLVENRPSKDNFSMGTSITSRRLKLLSNGLSDGFTLKNKYDDAGKVNGTVAILKIKKIEN